jgi:hypothetical protein
MKLIYNPESFEALDIAKGLLELLVRQEFNGT